MSYGWLTESSILPQKRKQIVVSDAGTIALQAAILDLKDKHKNNAKTPLKKPETIRNKGVDQRNQRDKNQVSTETNLQKNSYKALEKKANIYSQIKEKKTNISKMLVDFEAKQELDQSIIEQQQYEKDRQAFYSGRIKLVQDQQNAIHNNIETEKSSLTQMRERLAWERQMLSEMKGVNEDDAKPKVSQSFDHYLSKEEKQALGEVVGEGIQAKLRLQQIKRRKDLLQFERIRKLKKLNLIREENNDYNLQRKKEEEEK